MKSSIASWPWIIDVNNVFGVHVGDGNVLFLTTNTSLIPSLGDPLFLHPKFEYSNGTSYLGDVMLTTGGKHQFSSPMGICVDNGIYNYEEDMECYTEFEKTIVFIVIF